MEIVVSIILGGIVVCSLVVFALYYANKDYVEYKFLFLLLVFVISSLLIASVFCLGSDYGEKEGVRKYLNGECTVDTTSVTKKGYIRELELKFE